MTPSEKNRVAMARERETRTADYSSALAERDEAAAIVKRPDAEEFDHFALRRAEARVESALRMMNFWGDPIPQRAALTPAAPLAPAPAPSPSTPSTTPEVRQNAPFPFGVVEDPVEAIAARILASDGPAGSSTATEVDAVAMRIASTPLEGEAKRIEKGDGPADAEDILKPKGESVEDVARRILDA